LVVKGGVIVSQLLAAEWGSGRADLEQARDVLAELQRLRAAVGFEAAEQLEAWRPSIERRSFFLSAHNLAAYLALRRRDLRGLQLAMMPFGLSSLGRCESRVLENLDASIAMLSSAVQTGAPEMSTFPRPHAFFRGGRLLERHADEVFGPSSRRRDVRIMATLPSAAADDFELVHGLVRLGMDVARINCSHDDADAWRQMAAYVRRAAAESGQVCRVSMDLGGPRARTGAVRGGADEIRVREGMRFVLHEPGAGETGRQVLQVECSLPGVVGQLQIGQSVWVDEGSLCAVVEETDGQTALARVTRTGPKGARLRADKGLNFPDTQLRLSPLTSKDLRDLDTAAEVADIVAYSFVQKPSDIELLQSELAGRTRRQLALIAKIETGAAIRSLPEIIVQAAGKQPLAVMIARGDLAVEIGYPRLAEIQEELLWLCEAAHTPVIWATQVLDTFLHKGLHSRAEMTDAAMAERAECVMLNKGPYLADAVSVLDDVLGRMEGHQVKKTSRLRALHAW
jgi:pyruvate kinase